MKKTISVILCIVSMFLVLSPAVFATDNKAVKTERIDYADGSYGIITTVIENVASKDSKKTASKYYDHYDTSNVRQWQIKLTAQFSYNGSTATCTSATPSNTIYDNSWTITQSASRSGNTATGNFTAKKKVLGVVVQTVNKTLTITCSPTGTIS